MRVLRLFAVIFIFGVAGIAWMTLGASMWIRTEMLDEKLSAEMKSLWGPKVLAQAAPFWTPSGDRRGPDAVSPCESRIKVEIEHHNRCKGLLWYGTFKAKFTGRYVFPPARSGEGKGAAGCFVLALPKGISLLDGPTVTVDDKPVEAPRGGTLVVPYDRQTPGAITVTYATGGQDLWLYYPSDTPGASSRFGDYGEQVVSASDSLGELKDFEMSVTTNFAEIDYPRGARSPETPASPVKGGMQAVWKYANAQTNQAMGIVMPKPVNAGPVVARMSFFAPVSLLFFFTVLVAVIIIKKIPLHPMHYLFISAGFFAFHILMAYLVDLVNVHAAFWIAAAVSVFLVVSYMRLVAGVRFAATYVAMAQLAYLVGFSYAFFWVGRTGLTVTIGAIATLFVLMQATGRLDWSEVFKPPPRRDPDGGWTAVPPPPPPTRT